MKIRNVLVLLFFLLTMLPRGFGQEPIYQQQVGLTGLPIFYINNGIGNQGFSGLALYGSYGWIFHEKNVIGMRPFLGMVDERFDKTTRLNSVGMNIYYRRYFNQNSVSAFGDINTGLGYIWYTSTTADLQEKNGVLSNFAIGLGIDIRVKNGYNIEISLQYLQMTNLDQPELKSGKTLIPSIGVMKFF